MERQRDCLNVIRLLAALQVALPNHAMTHLHLTQLPEPLATAANFFHGIPIFFTLSGYLIWMSIKRSTSFAEYAQKRFWRIYPELWVAVLVEIAVLLLLFDGPVQWLKLGVFAVGQGTVFPFWVPGFLRSYGCGTPNGALWSIFALVQFYVIAYPLSKWLRGRHIVRWIIALSAFVLLSMAFNRARFIFPVTLRKLLEISFVPTFWMFVLGAFVSEYKDKILPALVRFWYVPVVLRIVEMHVGFPELPTYYYGFFHTLVLLAAILAIGYKFPFLNVKTDISYGIYIYHMTVINALIALGFCGPRVGGWALALVAICTCSLAFASTKTVGAFSKSIKGKILKKEVGK